MSTVTGVVLAGGRSQRMGHDKARLVLDGRTLLARAVACLDELCDEVLVASGDGQRLPGPWRQVADVVPDAGPLSGLVASLRAARGTEVAVLAVDLVTPSPPLLQWLIEQRGDAEAIVPRADGRLQPLHAVYATTAGEWLGDALQRGERSLTDVLQQRPAAVRVIEPEEWSDVADASFSRNLNRPEDAAAAGVTQQDQVS